MSFYPAKPQDVWKYVQKGKTNQCWPWVGGVFKSGYGQFNCNNKIYRAHRFIYALINGLIDRSLVIAHICNNKLCCNPKHLAAVPQKENMRHAILTGSLCVGKSGVRGICWRSDNNRWIARAFENGRLKNLYSGYSKDDAIKARKNWEQSIQINWR